MKRHVKPEKLELDVKDSVLNEEVFKLWSKTFENFLTSLTAAHVESNTDAYKLRLLTNFIFSVLFKYIETAADYAEAMQILKSLFVKRKNSLYDVKS